MASSMGTRLFADEAKSLRSFGVNSQPLASPPSLKASSLKLPSPLPFHYRVQQPTIRDLILDEDIDMGLPQISSTVSETPMSNKQGTLHQPWSKPRTIIRRLTTKFNLRVYTSSPVVPRLSPLPSGPNAFNKESRDAALRERGLLPPLRRNKDLSAQEKEQDRAIPIVFPKDDQRSSTEVDSPSAADLIKREWEAKNRLLESNQLQRMNSFKFGGNFSYPAAPVIQFSSSESVDSVILDTQALPASEPMPSSLAVIAIPPHLPPSTLEASPVQPSPSISQPGSRPVTPLLDIPPEIAAYLFPLPPSPRSVLRPKFELSSCPPSPTSVPLPRSPSLRCNVLDTTSLRSTSGALTPDPLDNRGISLTPTREVTDPTSDNLIRKKSMIVNPFKRGLSSGYEDHLTPSGERLQRRLSIKTSFSNLRRSVVGTLSRKTSSPDRGAGGTPSPISPGNLRSPTSLGSTMEEEEGEVRKAVSPTLYSRGHILMEASHIKDEESRRVTEMAFLT